MSDSTQRAVLLFREALDLAPSARAAFLAEQCGGDAALRATIDRLLARAGADSDDELDAVAAPSPLARLEQLASPAPPAASRDRTGETIGAFRVLRAIGSGGMGEVWLAERIAGGFAQQVAIKWLDARRLGADAIARFDRERAILARLDHPGIARIVDGGNDNGVPWFAMEFVDGVALDRHVAQLQPALPALLDIVVRLCDAVQYAHQNLVVHRDIKPSNILIDARGQPRLLDFGVAKALGESEALTQTRAPLTLAYAAPEQVTGAAVTTATDVYALGALLYELLTGRRPHEAAADSAISMMHAVTTTDPPPPSRVIASGDTTRWNAAALRGDLDTIVMKCLSREPSRRYASAQGLREDIDRFLDGRPVEARPDSTAYRLRKQIRRHPLTSALGAVAALALIALSIFSMMQAGRAEREAARSAAAAAEAEAQAQRATAVQDFLLSLFARQSPDTTGGESISARQLLDDAERDLAADAPLAPETRVALTETLANLRRELGDDRSAWRLVDAHVTLNERLHGKTSPEYGAALLMRAHYPSDGAGDALADCQAGLALVPADARHGARRANGLHNCAVALQEKERFDEAEKLIDEAEPLFKNHGEDRNEREFEIPLARAQLAQNSHDYPEAARLYTVYLAALDTWPQAPGTSRALALYNRALVHDDLGKTAEALADAEAALVINRRLRGDKHPHTINNRLKIAMYLAYTDRIEESKAMSAGALADARAAYGPGNGALAYALNDMAFAAFTTGDYVRARDHMAEAIPIATAAHGRDASHVLLMMGNLSSLQRKLGEFEASRKTADEIINRLSPDRADEFPARQAHWRRGLLAWTVFDPADAVAEGRWILAARARLKEPGGLANEETDAMELIAHGLRGMGRAAEARVAADALIEKARVLLPAGDNRLQSYLGVAARVAFDAGEWQRAYDISTEAIIDPPDGTSAWVGAPLAAALLVHRCTARRLGKTSPIKDFETRFAARKLAQAADEARAWKELAACAAP